MISFQYTFFFFIVNVKNSSIFSYRNIQLNKSGICLLGEVVIFNILTQINFFLY